MKINSSRLLLSTAFVIGCFAAFLPPSSFAELGKTADECTRIYGRPIDTVTYDVKAPSRIRYCYVWNGIDVRASLVGRDVKDSRCGQVTYTRVHGPNVPIKALSEEEIASLLARNAEGYQWERVPGGWKRTDNRALAVEWKYTNSGVPDNGLVVFRADYYPKDSKEHADVRASIPGSSAK